MRWLRNKRHRAAASPETRYPGEAAPWRRWALHGGLLALTFATTTLAGAEWIHQQLFWLGGPRDETFRLTGWLTSAQVLDGLWFSVPFLGVLTVHELGHFIMARRLGIRTSWPYYIPFYLGIGPSIGTMGAVIRIKDRIYSRREFFDVGIAGPLAGFAVLLPLLLVAFATLPAHLPAPPPPGLWLGRNLLLTGLEKAFGVPAALHPALTRQPLVLAGYLSAFFTALNLLPIGQLDGGHVLYGLLGPARAARLSVGAYAALVFYAGLGLVTPALAPATLAWAAPTYLGLLFVLARPTVPTPRLAAAVALGLGGLQFGVAAAWPNLSGNPGWLLLALFLARGVGLFHPVAPLDEALDRKRQALGWFAMALLVLCFAPSPFD